MTRWRVRILFVCVSGTRIPHVIASNLQLPAAGWFKFSSAAKRVFLTFRGHFSNRISFRILRAAIFTQKKKKRLKKRNLLSIFTFTKIISRWNECDLLSRSDNRYGGCEYNKICNARVFGKYFQRVIVYTANISDCSFQTRALHPPPGVCVFNSTNKFCWSRDTVLS